MPLFSNPFDIDVEKATSEMNTSEDWALLLDICDKAKQSQTASKNCLKSIMKRVFNKNPHVALQALSLLNACVKNSGKNFHLEVASRDFIADCRKIISEESLSLASRKVSRQLILFIKNWSENEFKTDSALSIIPSFYKSLNDEGINVSAEELPKLKKYSKDPNVVQSQEEEDDIAKAIALSLKEAEKVKTTSSSFQQPSSSTSSSIYPSMNSQIALNATLKQKEPKKVRALYDFEAVEDNELTFKAGEIIGVIDDSDQNWWKGVSWRGEGLFPANFVTFSLEVQDEEKQEVVELKDEVVEDEAAEVYVNKIDQAKIDTTLSMLQNADPMGDVGSDPENMVQYEEQCRKMLPLIDQELEKIDREHSRLTEVNDKLVRSLELYHTLMADLPSASKITGTMTTYQQLPLEQQMMMMQLQQQNQSINQYQSMPNQVHQLPSAQYQPQPIKVQPEQLGSHMAMQQQQSFQQQQNSFPQPYYNPLSAFTDMYLGTNGHPVNIANVPVMTGTHSTSEETSAAK